MSREKEFDKTITSLFDSLWGSDAYLGWMGQMMKMNVEWRKQWNKNMESFLTIFQLPNQEMQQRTLHQITTLLTEWRFEQEELNERIGQIENDIAELKELARPAKSGKGSSKS